MPDNPTAHDMLSSSQKCINHPACPPEEWCDIPGCLGYQISKRGNVRSRWSRDGRRRLRDTWRPIRQRATGHGHRTVSLFNGHCQVNLYVHRLVLETFVGPCPAGRCACHFNDIPWDNRLENLRWDTQKANMADLKRNGHRQDQSGSRGPNAKLTDEQVQTIRLKYRQGSTQKDLASEFGTAQQNISKIVKNQIWQNVT